MCMIHVYVLWTIVYSKAGGKLYVPLQPIRSRTTCKRFYRLLLCKAGRGEIDLLFKTARADSIPQISPAATPRGCRTTSAIPETWSPPPAALRGGWNKYAPGKPT